MRRAAVLGVSFSGARASAQRTQQQAQPLSKSETVSRTALLASYANQPLTFEANHGQTDGRVKFLTRGVGYELFLTANGAILLRDASLPEDVQGIDGPSISEFPKSLCFPGN